jgi:D-alanyl-D-alanine dipeptidase
MRRAAEQAGEAGLAGLLVAPGPDLQYFTGYMPVAITERLTLLVVQPDRDPTMIVPVLERLDAEAAPSAGAIELLDWTDGEDPYARIASVFRQDGIYAISDAAWALQLIGLQQALPGMGVRSMTACMPMLRAVKDYAELERLTAAGRAADACFGQIRAVRFSGRTENDVAADLAQLLLDHGHSQVDFTVVGSGPNGANPHHEADDRVIQDGDMVVLDYGGLKDGYGSDTSRTVHVGADPTEEELHVYDVVRQAQQTAFEAVAPGATCEDIDRAARQVISDAGYGEQFIHRTGHGIGLTTHEPPYIMEGEEQLDARDPDRRLSGGRGARLTPPPTAGPPTGGRAPRATARRRPGTTSSG